MEIAIYNDGDIKKYVEELNVQGEKGFSDIIKIGEEYCILANDSVFGEKKERLFFILRLETETRKEFFNRLNNYLADGWKTNGFMSVEQDKEIMILKR